LTLDAEVPADRSRSVLEAEQARASNGIGTTDTVIADADAKDVVAHIDIDLDPRCARVLGRIRQRLRGNVVGRHLDLLR
jgi:hypothetical protein